MSPAPRRWFFVLAGLLVFAGTGLFLVGAIDQLRQRKNPERVSPLPLAAWQIATAGFVCTLGGGLLLRSLVNALPESKAPPKPPDGSA